MNTIELPVDQFEELYKNSAAAGVTPSEVVGRLLDDEFGGLTLDAGHDFSLASLQSHLQDLEAILRAQ
jgi:hypothetical protein